MHTLEFPPDAIQKKHNKLNPYKSMGPDHIHPRIIKELAPTISEPLA